MDSKDSSQRYEFTVQDAKDISALFADLQKGVDAFEWMLSTKAGEALTHHFELSYLLRNIKSAIASSAGRLPSAACVLDQKEMYNLLCDGPLLDLTGGITTAVTFVKLSGEEGKFVRVVLEGLSNSERRLIKFMERPHEAQRDRDSDGTEPENSARTRLKKRSRDNGSKPRSARAHAKEPQDLNKSRVGKLPEAPIPRHH